MELSDLRSAIVQLIDNSRFYDYESPDKYKKAIKSLHHLIKLIDKKETDKFLAKKGDDSIDDP